MIKNSVEDDAKMAPNPHNLLQYVMMPLHNVAEAQKKKKNPKQIVFFYVS